MGTPSYMAPGSRPGVRLAPSALRRTSTSGNLYELLTGRPRSCGIGRGNGAASHRPGASAAIAAERQAPHLETICLKCLHKEPHLRYVTAAALGGDLERFLRGEAIAARPEGRLERLVRRVHRRPAFSAAVAVATLVTVALVGGTLWLLSEQVANERAAGARQAATEQAVEEDLREMAGWLRKSSWPEERAALERATARRPTYEAAWIRAPASWNC